MGLLSSKLRAAIGTTQWEKIPLESTFFARESTVEQSEDQGTPGILSSIDNLPGVIHNLEDVRNRYALRLQKGLADKILTHKNAEALLAWLELKPLFQASVILPESNGNLPYPKIAAFLKKTERQVRRYCSTWKKLRLAHFDQDKKLHLARYTRLNEIFEHRCRRKHFLINNGETKKLCRHIAVIENLQKQEYVRNRKIEQQELFNIIAERRLDPQQPMLLTELKRKGCEYVLSKREYRRLRKIVRNNMPVLLEKYKRIYAQNTLQLAFGFPGINPNVTLSCAGVARVAGCSSKSTGHRITKELERSGWMRRELTYTLIPERCPAVYESLTGMRTDIYSYQYPVRKSVTGKQRMYFRNNTQTLTPNEKAVFF